MRLLLLVFGLFFASLSGAGAGESPRAAVAGDGQRAVAERQPEPRAPPGKPHFRCAKKIVLGPDKSEVACLMKKHTFGGSTAAAKPPPAAAKPAQAPKEASGREQERRQPGRH